MNDRAIEYERKEIERILEVGATNGRLSDEDHAYLVRLIRQQANVSQEVADKRVDALSEKMNATAKSDLVATEVARRGGILLAFLTTATMVLGAAAAWWGAGVGGRHRDENFDASHLTRW
jgi:hypothetical protein